MASKEKEFVRTERMRQSYHRIVDVYYDARIKYLDKELDYADKWRDTAFAELYNKFKRKQEEADIIFQDAEMTDDNKYQILLDVINMASMVAARLKENMK